MPKAAEKDIVLQFAPGPDVEIDDPENEGQKKTVKGDPVPVLTARIRELDSEQADYVDDMVFTAAAQNAKFASRQRSMRAYGVASLVQLDGKTVSPLANEVEWKFVKSMLTPTQVNVLAAEYEKFSNELEVGHDPKSTPNAKP